MAHLLGRSLTILFGTVGIAAGPAMAGAAAMTRAERVAPLPEAAARQFGKHEPVPTAQLSATLDAIMRGQG